jgi:hypothetical protein
VSLLSRAQPNWAAPAYASAIVLVVGWAFARDWGRLVLASVALNLAAGLALFVGVDVLTASGVRMPAEADPLLRLRGWHQLGEQVGAALAAHPSLKLLADDREVLASLIYYVHPHPFDATIWSPLPAVKDQWALTNGLANHRGEDFLMVSKHDLVNEMRPIFTELTRLSEITISPGPNGTRTYVLYIARGFRGEK